MIASRTEGLILEYISDLCTVLEPASEFVESVRLMLIILLENNCNQMLTVNI